MIDLTANRCIDKPKVTIHVFAPLIEQQVFELALLLIESTNIQKCHPDGLKNAINFLYWLYTDYPERLVLPKERHDVKFQLFDVYREL